MIWSLVTTGVSGSMVPVVLHVAPLSILLRCSGQEQPVQRVACSCRKEGNLLKLEQRTDLLTF